MADKIYEVLMGSRSLWILLAVATVLFRYEFAQADLRTRKNVSCAIKLSDLNYVGLNFTGSSECVDAFNDTDAIRACKGRLVINPGNPQYGIPGVGTLNTNTLGYYYCVAPQNRKDRMCQVDAKKKFPQLQFRWEKITRSDGNCYCGSKESDINSLHDCSRDPESVAAAVKNECEKLNLRRDNRQQTALSSAEKAVTQCQCASNDSYYALNEAKEKCSAVAAAPVMTAATVSSSTAAVKEEAAEKSVDKVLEDCVKDWVKLSESCKTKSLVAKKACSTAKKENEDSDIAGDLLTAGGQFATITKTNSGSQAECFAAGVGTMGAREAIKALQVTCEAEYEACSQECSAEKYDEYLKVCAKKVKISADDLMNQDSVNGQYFKTNADAIKENFDEGTKICKSEARHRKSNLSSLLEGVGNALRDSLRCACKFSNSGGTDCNAIPSINYCEQVPQPAGCEGYGSVAICTPGSMGYDARTCACLQNPGAPGCSSVTGGNSTFGGPGVSTPTASTAPSGGVIGGGLRGGGSFSDLSGGAAGGAERTNFANNAKASVNSGGGSGGGGLSSGGGGGGSGSAPAAEAALSGDGTEKSTSLGDVFNQAKNFLTNSLGFVNKKNPQNSVIKGNGSDAADMSKFRPPLRGLAGKQAPGGGTKNMEIWNMMHLCADGVTCKSNQDNYIIGP